MSGNGRMDVEAVLREALELGEEGRWEDMATLLSETLDRQEDDPYLLCWLGVAEGDLGTVVAAKDGGNPLLIAWDSWAGGHDGNCDTVDDLCTACVNEDTADRWWNKCAAIEVVE